MKKTLNILLFPLILFTLTCSLIAKEDYAVEIQSLAVELAYDLPAEGTLRVKDNGFVYLDVSNEFIDSISPLLEMQGEFRPRPTSKKSMGAHISVMYEKEGVTPMEIGQTFSFQVKELHSFTVHTRDGSKHYWAVAVDSPELENLRENYGLKPKLQGHDFHITLGKRMPVAPDGWEEVETVSELNFEGEPTSGLSTTGDFVVVENPDLLKVAKKVDQVAQLTLKKNGYGYLNVDNQILDLVSPYFSGHDTFKPNSQKGEGAHISVFYESDLVEKQVWVLEEAGQWFTFEIKELRYFDRKTPKGMDRIWMLAVEAPGLERLRMQYGLKPKLQGHDFHITLGKEKIEIEEIQEAA